MSTRRRTLHRSLQTLLAVGFAAAWAVPAMTAETPEWSTTWRTSPAVVAVDEWSPRLAELFPGCREELPEGVVPATVVEVQDGWPVRVAFADAWARTHDGDEGNHGEVLAQCR